jgi:hypothetical protein
MSTIKTAISIDTTTFRKVQSLTRKLHISRSQFFGQAARHMIQRDENLDLLRRINASYKQDGEDIIRKRHEKSYARRKTIERW